MAPRAGLQEGAGGPGAGVALGGDRRHPAGIGVPGDHQHRIGRAVGAADVGHQAVPGLGVDRRRRAGDLPAERLLGPEQLGHELVHPLPRSVLGQTELLEDDPLLFLQLGRFEQGRLDHVRQQVESQLGVAAGHLGVVGGQLLVRDGVENPAHALDRLGDALGARVAPRALEEHVLHQVGDALLLGRLVAGAGAEVEGDRHRAGVGHRGDQHAQPVGQDVPDVGAVAAGLHQRWGLYGAGGEGGADMGEGRSEEHDSAWATGGRRPSEEHEDPSARGSGSGVTSTVRARFSGSPPRRSSAATAGAPSPRATPPAGSPAAAGLP